MEINIFSSGETELLVYDDGPYLAILYDNGNPIVLDRVQLNELINCYKESKGEKPDILE